MRGKASQYGYDSYENRITPAYAGKRKNTVKTTKGEYGSPPPMRGKVPVAVELDFSVRITPAYAGKSIAGRASCINPQDHPRLCGEKSFWGRFRRKSKGSPPPMRGKESTLYQDYTTLRITPAYAGKS